MGLFLFYVGDGLRICGETFSGKNFEWLRLGVFRIWGTLILVERYVDLGRLFEALL